MMWPGHFSVRRAAQRATQGAEAGMVSVETALSLGAVVAVLALLMIPLMGWIYAIDAGHSAREIAREYSLHGQPATNNLIARITQSGDDVSIERQGEYVQVTVVKKLPAVMDWLGVKIKDSQLVVIEPDG